MTDKKQPLLLVLDLDECLIYSEYSHKPNTLGQPDFQHEKYRTYKRQHLDLFLQQISLNPLLELGVWTSATGDYADYIINNIFPNPSVLKFVFTIQNCVAKEMPCDAMYHNGIKQFDYKKDLQKVVNRTGHSLERMIALDDNPAFYTRQYSNLIKIPKFTGGNDDYLLHALDFINRLERLDNVRPLEKRNWLSRYEKNSEFDYCF